MNILLAFSFSNLAVASCRSFRTNSNRAISRANSSLDLRLIGFIAVRAEASISFREALGQNKLWKKSIFNDRKFLISH